MRRPSFLFFTSAPIAGALHFRAEYGTGLSRPGRSFHRQLLRELPPKIAIEDPVAPEATCQLDDVLEAHPFHLLQNKLPSPTAEVALY